MHSALHQDVLSATTRQLMIAATLLPPAEAAAIVSSTRILLQRYPHLGACLESEVDNVPVRLDSLHSSVGLEPEAALVLESSAWELTVLAAHFDPEVARQARCLALKETPSLVDAPLRVLIRVHDDAAAGQHGAPEQIATRPATGGSCPVRERAGWCIPTY